MKIITFNGTYIPGYKAGGPIRSIENMTFYLQKKIYFFILTNDRDVGENESYKDIKIDKWNEIGFANVYYKSPSKKLTRTIYKVLNDQEHDAVLLNGVFSEYSMRYLMLRMLKIVPDKKVFLMPRGDLADGALSLKSSKKMLYLKIVKKLGMYKNIEFIATSMEEKRNINKVFYDETDCHLVSNFPNKELLSSRVNYLKKEKGSLKLIYLSRITPVKNLKFSLEVLKDIKGEVEFDIYGPIYDVNYWNECLEMIKILPDNIKVNYLGEVDNKFVSSILKKYHALFLPTLGENYGHVIVESLLNGTPVIISDKTPWIDVDNFDAGWALSLEAKEKFTEKISYLISLDYNSYNKHREKSREYVLKKQKPDEIKKEYLEIFI